MRKILLGTTAVAGAALFAVSTAQAQQAPTVRVGGFMLNSMNIVSDSADTAQVTSSGRTSSSASTDFRTELEVQVFVTGKAANGLEYGAVIELQNDGVFNTTVDIDESYVFVSSPTLGTIRFGEEDSAASLMQVRVPTISGMGPDGDFDDALRTGAMSILTGINDGSDATKIIYLSPQFAGFDFGISYAPNAGEGERGMTVTTSSTSATAVTANTPQRDRATIENELSMALRYRGTIGPVGVQAGLGYMQADPAFADQTTLQDIKVYTAGLNLSALGFTVGGEYTWGKYSGTSVGRTALTNGRDDSSHWLIGATYTAGALAIGAFYGVGEQDRGGTSGVREQTVWGIGGAYTLAPGLELIASYNHVEDKNIASAVGNNAAGSTRDVSVFFAGTRLAF